MRKEKGRRLGAGPKTKTDLDRRPEMARTILPSTQASSHRSAPETREAGPGPTLREIVAALEGELYARDWKRALSARSVYVALLRLARDHGTMIAAGVEISVSVRQLKEKAGIKSMATITRAKETLKRYGLLRQGERGHGTIPDKLVLVCNESSYSVGGTLTQGFAKQQGVSLTSSECSTYGARVAFAWFGLGKSKEMFLDVVRRAGGAATAREVAAATGRQLYRVRAHLDELAQDRVLVKQGDSYAFHRDTGFELWALREAIPAESEGDEQLRKKHQEQREKFRALWEAGEVIGQRERAARERWLEKKAERERAARLKELDADDFVERLEKIDLMPATPAGAEASDQGETLTPGQQNRAERLAKPQNDVCRGAHAPAAPEPEPERQEAASESAAVNVGPLAEALAEYLERNPHDRDQPASWLGITVWAHSLVSCKPTADDMKDALIALESVG